jgi:hypothetical protein
MKTEIISIFVLLLTISIYGQNKYYVPVNNGNDNSIGVDEFDATLITKHLISFNEKNLTEYKCECEIYRFLWLRSFHNPIVITITKTESNISLQWKRTDGEGDFEPKNLVENRIIFLSIMQWSEFKEKLNNIVFWNNPTKFDENIVRVLDGSYMIMEGIKNNQYHISEIDIYKISNYLIELTELDIPEKEKY